MRMESRAPCLEQTTRNSSSRDEEEQRIISHHPLEESQSVLWSMSLFVLLALLLNADQNLMAPNLTAIARDFGMSDLERDVQLGGHVSLGFFLVGGVAALVVGYWTDRSTNISRIALLSGTVAVGECACIATYFCNNFYQLFLCRAVTGFSLGGATPVMFALVGDWVDAPDRPVAVSLLMIGTGVGVGVGQLVAGMLGPTYGWRLPFLVIGIPALACSAVVYFTLEDPPRGGAEGLYHVMPSSNGVFVQQQGAQDKIPLAHHTERDGTDRNDNDDNDDSFLGQTKAIDTDEDSTCCSTVKDLMTTKTMILIMIQGIPAYVPIGIGNTFMVDYLAQDRGYTVQSATGIFFIYGIGYLGGIFAGGWIGRALYRQRPKYLPYFTACLPLVGIGIWTSWINSQAETTRHWQLLATATGAGVCTGPILPLVKSMVLNVTLPQQRGQAIALYTLSTEAGGGIVPWMVASWIRHYHGNRQAALQTSLWLWGCVSWVHLGISCTLEGDQERMVQRWMRQVSEKQRHRPRDTELVPIT